MGSCVDGGVGSSAAVVGAWKGGEVGLMGAVGGVLGSEGICDGGAERVAWAGDD